MDPTELKTEFMRQSGHTVCMSADCWNMMPGQCDTCGNDLEKICHDCGGRSCCKKRLCDGCNNCAEHILPCILDNFACNKPANELALHRLCFNDDSTFADFEYIYRLLFYPESNLTNEVVAQFIDDVSVFGIYRESAEYRYREKIYTLYVHEKVSMKDERHRIIMRIMMHRYAAQYRR